MKEFLTRVFSDPTTVRKFVVAFFGAISVAIAQGLLPENWSSWVTVVVAFLTSVGVYGVPNKEDSPTEAQLRLRANTERGAINILELLVIVLVIVLILVIVGVI